MSLYKYFSKPSNTSSCEQAKQVVDSLRSSISSTSGVPGCISEREIIYVQEELQNIIDDPGKSRRTTYSEQCKLRVGRYAAENGVYSAVTHFKKEFPKLSASTVRPWANKYKKKLVDPTITIGVRRGRPLYLSRELDQKLQAMLINLRTAGAEVSSVVVKGVLAGLVRSNLTKYGQFVDFQVNRSWVRSLYQRMSFSRRASTTSRPIITRSVWEELRDQFLHDIGTKVAENDIPDELIFNADQTPSKYVATSKVTMAKRNSKHVPIKGGGDKRAITITIIESLSGEFLPFQIIYKGKTKRSLPINASKDTHKFLFSFNMKHWSNEKETLRLIDHVLVPHIKEVKQNLNLPANQKALLIWDAFTGQNTEKVTRRLEELNIVSVLVPKNLTHLLQPLDITTNGKIKKMERAAFSDYLTNAIMEYLSENPGADVTEIDIDLKLSTLKPKHLATLTRIYEFFKSDDGKRIILSGFRYTGILDVVMKARNGDIAPLDPYI